MLRHCLMMAVAAAALTIAAQARAQTGPGTIYYLYEPTATYRVAGTGNLEARGLSFPDQQD